jgi:multidrug transporter EmrE-like cation transporter
VIPPAELPLYILYAVIGTIAAALAKRSMEKLFVRQWVGALGQFVCAATLMICNFALLIRFLDEGAVSVVAPVAIGINLLVAAVIARVWFREKLNRQRWLGMGLILVGVILVSWG